MIIDGKVFEPITIVKRGYLCKANGKKYGLKVVISQSKILKADKYAVFYCPKTNEILLKPLEDLIKDVD